uniref:Putative pheromone protein n=1 Tax=Flammulina velutipes TaxID=38945 RepID=A0A6C0N0Y2_FLAVE|nr:putative pheromone precursor protein [Flammulina velutipes]
MDSFVDIFAPAEEIVINAPEDPTVNAERTGGDVAAMCIIS